MIKILCLNERPIVDITDATAEQIEAIKSDHYDPTRVQAWKIVEVPIMVDGNSVEYHRLKGAEHQLRLMHIELSRLGDSFEDMANACLFHAQQIERSI